MLYCIVLYCIVLYCIVLYCIVLYRYEGEKRGCNIVACPGNTKELYRKEDMTQEWRYVERLISRYKSLQYVLETTRSTHR